MLKELYIKNIAVIEEERLVFASGFQVMTGETGTGKSVLMGSLGLIIGNKAIPSMIRDGADEATVEAIYDISHFHELKIALRDTSFLSDESENELIIKRQILRDGQSKVYINQQRSTLAFLQSISGHLMDYSGQRQQNELLDTSRDIHILDSFLQNPKVKTEYTDNYQSLKQLSRHIEEIRKIENEKTERLEWLKFKMKEFDSLSVSSEDELQELKNKRERLKNLTSIRELGELAEQILSANGEGCSTQLHRLKQSLSKNQYISNHCPKLLESLSSLQVQVDDLAYEIAKVTTEKVMEDMNLDQIEEQLHVVEKLQRKFGPGMNEILAEKDRLQNETFRLENSTDELAKMEKEFSEKLEQLKKLSKKLSEARFHLKVDLERFVSIELESLRMKGVQFVVQIIPHPDLNDMSCFGMDGTDSVTFMLSPNPGLSLRPLSKIASGGETSRIFLALKKVLSHQRQNGTLVFDEVDTGVSGAEAHLVGQKLKDLSKRFQVFCITHHPQIASLADQHYFVEKKVVKKKTFTRIRSLNHDERIGEIARMMGGLKISQKNLDYAKEMLGPLQKNIN